MRKGQASVLTMVIMTALALVISLAIWNLFMSSAAIQREEALTAATLARESTRISVINLASVNVSGAYRFAFQFVTIDYQPASLYLMVLESVTESPRPMSFTLYEVLRPSADISNSSMLNPVSNTTAHTEAADSEYVMIRPLNSNEYAPLSIYYDSTVRPYRVFLRGEPECYVIEVPSSAVSNQAQLIVLIKISNKYYQITALPLS